MAFYDFEINGENRRFQRMGHLGQGAFGQVHLVADARTRQQFAVKVINTHRSDLLQSARQEVMQLTLVSHSNIIQIFAAKQDGLQVHILLEYCPGGNLDMKLTPRISTTIEQDKKWAFQVTGAIAYLHSKNIVHRDLKPQNILLTANEDAKVADFGLARPFMTGPNWQQTYQTYYMQTTAGTPSYMAPEVWRGHYTEKADVYSIGVMLLVMFGRKAIPNFYGRLQEDAHAMAQKMSTTGNIDQNMKSLVLDMLAHEYRARPSASEAHQKILAFTQQSGWWDLCTIL